MTDRYIPRFSFEISPEMKARADRLLDTHGIRKAVMTPILDDLLNLIEKHGHLVIGALLDDAHKPSELMPTLNKAERKAKK